MRSILKRQINQDWFTVIAEATNGEGAIEQYKKYGPNIVLMDLTMPKMTGIEALTKIKYLDQNANVVICSSLGGQDTIIEALKFGAKDFVVKPYFHNLNYILKNM